MSELLHSHLGASSAHRWMECSGSVTLAKEMEPADDYSDDPSYRSEGTAAHAVATECLLNGCDTWEVANEIFNGYIASVLDLDHIQTYVDHCRSVTKDADESWIEHSIGEKVEDRPHPAFFGTADYAVLSATDLNVVDFKYGAGVSVSPVENPQCLYYAYGVLLDIKRAGEHRLDPEFPVRISIVQPRVAGEASIRPWNTTVGAVFKWAREILLPKMFEAEKTTVFKAGDHCRFCPAKVACPLLKGMFAVASAVNTRWLKDANWYSLGQEYAMIGAVKKYIKAVEEETYNRLMAGRPVDGTKLVQQRANRVWKDGALETLDMIFGALAMTEPQFKSPAQLEALGEQAKEYVKEWAYIPQTGFTVALADDKRAEVKVDTPGETFAHFISGSNGENP